MRKGISALVFSIFLAYMPIAAQTKLDLKPKGPKPVLKTLPVESTDFYEKAHDVKRKIYLEKTVDEHYEELEEIAEKFVTTGKLDQKYSIHYHEGGIMGLINKVGLGFFRLFKECQITLDLNEKKYDPDKDDGIIHGKAKMKIIGQEIKYERKVTKKNGNIKVELEEILNVKKLDIKTKYRKIGNKPYEIVNREDPDNKYPLIQEGIQISSDDFINKFHNFLEYHESYFNVGDDSCQIEILVNGARARVTVIKEEITPEIYRFTAGTGELTSVKIKQISCDAFYSQFNNLLVPIYFLVQTYDEVKDKNDNIISRKPGEWIDGKIKF